MTEDRIKKVRTFSIPVAIFGALTGLRILFFVGFATMFLTTAVLLVTYLMSRRTSLT